MKIKECRKKSGLTQEKFAELIGVAPRHVSRIENGVNTPSVETLGKIAEILCVDVKDLFDFPYFQDELFLREKITTIVNGLDKNNLKKVYNILNSIFK